jgi:hypothetical protein
MDDVIHSGEGGDRMTGILKISVGHRMCPTHS